MNADRSDQVQLTTDPAQDLNPAWSPDGTKIAFDSTRTGDSEIFVMDVDGSNPVRTTTTDPSTYNSAPAWSPDGSMIAFGGIRNFNFDIFRINADGSGEVRLADDLDQDVSPSWFRARPVPAEKVPTLGRTGIAVMTVFLILAALLLLRRSGLPLR